MQTGTWIWTTICTSKDLVLDVDPHGMWIWSVIWIHTRGHLDLDLSYGAEWALDLLQLCQLCSLVQSPPRPWFQIPTDISSLQDHTHTIQVYWAGFYPYPVEYLVIGLLSNADSNPWTISG